MSDNRDVIRNRILNEVDETYDKLPGSYVWEQSQATAIELEAKYAEIEDAINQKFAGTADFENLKVIAFEKGVDWKDATFATGVVKVTGVQNAVVNIGDLFASQLNQYAATETVSLDQTGIASVKVRCTTAGSSGNTPIGTITLFPKTLPGINTVTNEVAIVDGYNAETRDELLARYYKAIRKPATSGNAYHYEQWAESVDGVGAAKIKPLWNGGGTVKIVIIDRNKQAATQTLINEVQTYIDSQRPIGASPTVVTAEELVININCNLNLKLNYTLEQVKTDIEQKIASYFKDSAFVDVAVYYAKIGNIIFTAEGVSNIDYSTLELNSQKGDIMLEDSNAKTQIPKLGTLTLVAV